jgi:hypothetical protein
MASGNYKHATINTGHISKKKGELVSISHGLLKNFKGPLKYEDDF